MSGDDVDGTGARQKELGLRLILASLALDRAYARLDRIRSALILAFAPDSLLDRFNEWAYSRSEVYRPGMPGFRRHLYPWEEHVIATFFPPPPARILVGGAGAGREPLALAKMGYHVVAFEPAFSLAEAMNVQVKAEGHGMSIDVFRGGYEDLPILVQVADDSKAQLNDVGPFEAAIVGWGSFSHLRTESLRVKTLQAFAAVTSGPILVSFILVKPDEEVSPPRRHGLARLLTRRGRHPGDRFSMRMGFQHPVSERELAALADRTGLEILELNFAGGETFAPYVVLRRAANRRHP